MKIEITELISFLKERYDWENKLAKEARLRGSRTYAILAEERALAIAVIMDEIRLKYIKENEVSIEG